MEGKMGRKPALEEGLFGSSSATSRPQTSAASASVTAFEDFWSHYPRKRAKQDAWKAWQKITLTQDLLVTMALAIDAQLRSRQWRDGFIPYPATWLRRHQWEDELAPADFHQARL